MAEDAGPGAPVLDAAELGAFEPERNGHQTNGAGATLMGAEDFVPLSDQNGGAVHGRVRRSDGTGITGAALTLIDSAGRQIGRNVSGSDGEYHLPAPEPGSYVLIASAGAHQPQATFVSVGGGPVPLDVVLTGTSSLAGLVTVAGSGSPVAGAVATLADGAGDVVGTRATGFGRELPVRRARRGRLHPGDQRGGLSAGRAGGHGAGHGQHRRTWRWSAGRGCAEWRRSATAGPCRTRGSPCWTGPATSLR